MAPEFLVVDEVCARSYSGQERAFLLDLVRGRMAEGKITGQTTNLHLDITAQEEIYSQFLDGRVLSTYNGWRVNASKWGPSLRGRDDSQTGS